MFRRCLLAIAFLGIMEVFFPALPLNAAESRGCFHPLTTLMPPLLADLPSYTNRVIQRTRVTPRQTPLERYILSAGNVDFNPLPYPQQQWQSTVENTTRQVFFTTLEREYTEQRVIERQNFYWAFLVETQQGWQLAVLYQQLGSESPHRSPSPRRDVSTASIAQGIKLWLRDCRAGVEPHNEP